MGVWMAQEPLPSAYFSDVFADTGMGDYMSPVVTTQG